MADQETARIGQLAPSSQLEGLLIRRLWGREAVSEPFRFELEVAARDIELPLDGMLGRSVTFLLLMADDRPRYVNGVVAAMRHESADLTGAIYRLQLVPWFSLLRHRTDCRVFQDLTVPEIVARVFEPYQFADLEPRLDGEYQPRLHCVQYRESDHDFVARLLEEEGIAYHFEHEDGRHVMVLVDSPQRREPCPDQPTVLYRTADQAADEATGWGQDMVREFRPEQQLRSGTYQVVDFNLHDPGTSLTAPGASQFQLPVNEQLESYQYPGEFVKLGAEDAQKLPFGEQRAELLAERRDVEVLQAQGESDCRAFRPGTTVELLNHPTAAFCDQWLLLAVEHELDQTATLSSTATGEARYANRFTALPGRVPFRPSRATPRPRMHGPQTAMVTGPEGEEIHTDRLGRVKVCFHWDRYGPRDGSDSCWVRVAQGWAGGGWGAQFVPRIGQEVVVDFLDGDPDQPLVTGSVYNGRNAIPFEHPTQSGIRTRSSREGSSQNGNEIRFEDQKDQEELFVQAERDLTVNVKQASSTSVGADAGTTVSGDNSLTVSGDDTTTVEGTRTVTVTGDQTHELAASDIASVGGDSKLDVTGALAQKVGGDASLDVTGKVAITATEITLTAHAKIRLQVAGSYIEVAPGGITVHGPMAELSADGEAKLAGATARVEGAGETSVSGLQVTVSGSTAVNVSGATVNIN
jgi:type VI secretion system secreted protein VgrG